MLIHEFIWLVLTALSTGLVPGGPITQYPLRGPAIRCQIWRNVSGAQITDTLATADLSRAPDETRLIDKLEFNPDFKDPWAATLTGFISVKETGAYWFNIASRDSGVLFLSSDESEANLRFIAETPAATDLHFYRAYSAQTSDGVRLIAGKKYLIQAIVKSGPGPGGISIAWQMPKGVFQGPIPAARFSPVQADIPPRNMRVDHFSLSLKPQPSPTTQPGVHPFVRGAQFEVNGQTSEMSYLLDLPKDFNTTSDERPMLVFLHGNNRQGYDCQAIQAIGPVLQARKTPQLGDWMPMILMCPQLPPGWRWDTPGAPQAVDALVEQLCDRYPRIDRRRLYLTGLSMGGKGTWLTLEHAPQLYAAVVPISAVDVRPDLAPDLLKDLPELHIVCGGDDGGFTAGSHRMYEALKSALGQRVQLTVYPHEGHNVWDHLYADRSFYENLMRFSR